MIALKTIYELWECIWHATRFKSYFYVYPCNIYFFSFKSQKPEHSVCHHVACATNTRATNTRATRLCLQKTTSSKPDDYFVATTNSKKCADNQQKSLTGVTI